MMACHAVCALSRTPHTEYRTPERQLFPGRVVCPRQAISAVRKVPATHADFSLIVAEKVRLFDEDEHGAGRP